MSERDDDIPGPYDNMDNDDLWFLWRTTKERGMLEELKRRCEEDLKLYKRLLDE